MVFLSFGAGVQSSVMLMMAIRGEIERPDHVIFADTGGDGAATLDHVDWSEAQCAKAGIPFHRVGNGNIIDAAMASGGSREYDGDRTSMPYFLRNPDGTSGMLRRKCTSEYKIKPLKAKQRELLGYAPRKRIPAGACAVLIGISTDEARRAAPSQDAWIDNVFPLIDPIKMSRIDCQRWWEDHYPHRKLGKSSCVCCPYKADSEWARMKKTEPGEWAKVVDLDSRIRVSQGVNGTAYLHRSLRPLAEVDFGEAQGALDLDDDIYCAGGCGL